MNKSNLKLVVSNTRRPRTKPTVARPFETDYAGAWKGHCKTRESAIHAAEKHLVSDGYTRATITDVRTGQVVARLSMPTNLRVVIDVIKPFRKLVR